MCLDVYIGDHKASYNQKKKINKLLPFTYLFTFSTRLRLLYHVLLSWHRNPKGSSPNPNAPALPPEARGIYLAWKNFGFRRFWSFSVFVFTGYKAFWLSRSALKVTMIRWRLPELTILATYYLFVFVYRDVWQVCQVVGISQCLILHWQDQHKRHGCVYCKSFISPVSSLGFLFSANVKNILSTWWFQVFPKRLVNWKVVVPKRSWKVKSK